jgi:hypothetical protein
MAATVFGMGGYAYAFYDEQKYPASPPYGSTACVGTSSFCGLGTSSEANAAAAGTAPAYGYYGGGIGVNVDQTMTTGATPSSYTPTGSGITYAITGTPPAGLRLVVGNGITDYCANITGASGTVTWSQFNTECWQPDAGVGLSAPPATTHVEFEISAGSTATAWDFCVTALSFAP